MKRSDNKKSSISKAKTYGAISDYWDTHDVSDVLDKTRSVRADVNLESEEFFYGIEKGLSQTLHRAAKERGISPHTLINLWLQEKIQELKLAPGQR